MSVSIVTDDCFAVSVEEAMDRLGIGRTKIYELINSGELRSIKIGSRRLVPISAIRELLHGGRSRHDLHL